MSCFGLIVLRLDSSVNQDQSLVWKESKILKSSLFIEISDVIEFDESTVESLFYAVETLQTKQRRFNLEWVFLLYEKEYNYGSENDDKNKVVPV